MTVIFLFKETGSRITSIRTSDLGGRVTVGPGSRELNVVVDVGWVVETGDVVTCGIGVGVGAGPDVPVQPVARAAARTMRTGTMASFQFIPEGLGSRYNGFVVGHPEGRVSCAPAGPDAFPQNHSGRGGSEMPIHFETILKREKETVFA
jgi:hypothetical protein